MTYEETKDAKSKAGKSARDGKKEHKCAGDRFTMMLFEKPAAQ